MKVLIVEDDINFSNSLVAEFQHREIEASAFDDPISALEVDEIFSHILLDLRLGQFNSLNFVEKFREKHTNAKIFILTGFGSISTTVEAIKKGADDYLTKPINFSVLYDRITGKDANDTLVEDGMTLDRNEREYIEFVLHKCEGNITKAAKTLGIHRQSLQRKLKKYTPR